MTAVVASASTCPLFGRGRREGVRGLHGRNDGWWFVRLLKTSNEKTKSVVKWHNNWKKYIGWDENTGGRWQSRRRRRRPGTGVCGEYRKVRKHIRRGDDLEVGPEEFTVPIKNIKIPMSPVVLFHKPPNTKDYKFTILRLLGSLLSSAGNTLASRSRSHWYFLPRTIFWSMILKI